MLDEAQRRLITACVVTAEGLTTELLTAPQEARNNDAWGVNGGVKARDSGVLGFDRRCFQNRSLREPYERQAFIKLVLPLRLTPSGRRVDRAQVLLGRCGERSARCPGLPSPSPLS